MLENFIYTKRKASFEEALNNGEVLDEAIVFIEDTKEIWNHGTYFDGSKVDLSNIEEAVSKIKTNGDGTKFLSNNGEYKGLKTINGENIVGSGDITVQTDANIQAVDTTDEIEDVETNTYVKYVALTLTDELKALVRENIGALSTSDLVTVDLSNYYTKSEIDTKIGDINTILESIINS